MVKFHPLINHNNGESSSIRPSRLAFVIAVESTSEDCAVPLSPLDRRTFLRSAGVCIGLPLLDAMLPIGLGADRKAAAMRPKRMLLISQPLGLHAAEFLPDPDRDGL